VDVQINPTIPKEIKINNDSLDKDEYSKISSDQVISPPLDDSWSTHHRLINQFEEKYGSLIAQQHEQQEQEKQKNHPKQQNQTSQCSIDSIQYSNYMENPNLFQPTFTMEQPRYMDSDPSIFYNSYNSYNPTIYTGKNTKNQHGWKRKKNDLDTNRRILPPRLSFHNP